MAGIGSSSPHSKQWVKGNAVGFGSFGIVNLAMNKSNGELFVVKSAPSGKGFQSLENEANILRNLNSPYIVRCLGHDICEEEKGEKKLNLFMEFMAGGSLSDILKKFGGALDESVIRSYTKEILHGLNYLHNHGIVHCDLKCKNVLLGSSGNIKLADFGCARRLDSLKTNARSKSLCQSVCGTPLWMAPEVLKNEGMDYASDVWSLGCTVIEMATGRPPWSDDISNPMAAVYKIACSTDLPRFPTKFSEEGLDFLRKCLRRDPKSRCSTEELLNHPFISAKGPDMDYYSPTSILGPRDWDSDGSESLAHEKSLTRIPFSTRYSDQTRKHRREINFAPSENWIVVRSG